MRTLVWFRGKDLRLADHAPLSGAARQGEIIPLFVVDPYFFAPERAAELPHRMQFLVESLTELAERVAELGAPMVFVRGRSVDVVPRVARELDASRVVAMRWTEPLGRARDARVAEGLGAIPLELGDGETLARPGELLTGGGTPYSVFTPYYRAFRAKVEVGPPLRAPSSLAPASRDPVAILRAAGLDAGRDPPTLASLRITHNPRLAKGGERAAIARLKAFLKGPGADYETLRDRMDKAGTSRMSQDLKFGTLSPRAVYRAVDAGLVDSPRAREAYLRELVWRELAYDVLFHRPEVLERPFRPAWEGFPFRRAPAEWRAWVEGRTGYPVVDAAARQLLGEGFVHNRARMISASFLTKHLLVDFREGEAHYMKYLTDGDWAANDLGWQWSAGSGCDAQPWFRVFNPVTQGEKFDPDGTYVRTWVPELARVPAKWIHAPWTAPEAELARAGVRLGKDYPRPIVDHGLARGRFLAAAKGHLGS